MRPLTWLGLLAVALVPAALTPRPLAALAHRAGPRPLTRHDFYSNIATGSSPTSAGTYYLDHAPLATVAGAAYPRALDLRPLGASAPAGVSVNTARFPGYRALTFAVGVADSDPVNAVAHVQVTVDRKPVWRQDLQQGQLAVPVTIPFGSRPQAVISIVATTVHSGDGFIDVIVGNAAVLPGGTRGPAACPPPSL